MKRGRGGNRSEKRKISADRWEKGTGELMEGREGQWWRNIYYLLQVCMLFFLSHSIKGAAGGPAYERSFRWKVGQFRHLCQVQMIQQDFSIFTWEMAKPFPKYGANSLFRSIPVYFFGNLLTSA